MAVAYSTIDAFEEKGVEDWPSVGAMLAEASVMRENQELFELHVSDYLPLIRCQVSKFIPIFLSLILCDHIDQAGKAPPKNFQG